MSTPRKFLPSIASLRALEALDRLESASAVADELNLTQSAVSRQLQSLERQMGVDLILREKKRLSLTPAAADYASDVRQALGMIAQASLKLTVNPLGGTVNLAILPAFGMRWLMPRLPEFARLHPDVTINMSTQLEPFNFATHSFDAAIHFGHADWPGTERLILRHETLLPVCAASLIAGTAPKAASEVARLPLLHIETRPQAWQDWFDHHDAAVPTPLPGTMYDQFSTIIQAAIHGLGVALVPDYLVEQELATGRLHVVFGGPTEAKGAYYLVWPASKARTSALWEFRSWLETQAEPEDPLPR